jgi:hypothetical protein
MMNLELLRPKDLNNNEWRQLQALSRDSFGEQFEHRSQAEIDTLTAWTEPDTYRESRIHPNRVADTDLNPDQVFHKPRVAIAVDGNDFLGFGYVADNVSGSSLLERTLKLLGYNKNYLWIRELVVRPDAKGHNISKQIGKRLLMSGEPWQPVSADVWPDEDSRMFTRLSGISFKPTGEQTVHPFGKDAEPVRQVRMQADSTYGVLKQLITHS